MTVIWKPWQHEVKYFVEIGRASLSVRILRYKVEKGLRGVYFFDTSDKPNLKLCVM